MITLHSIDLVYMHDKCFAEAYNGMCRLLTEESEHCRTHKCPFYKPEGCKDWIRVQDDRGTQLVPPEEYREYYRRKDEQRASIRK